MCNDVAEAVDRLDEVEHVHEIVLFEGTQKFTLQNRAIQLDSLTLR